MNARELIEAKRTYDELKAHFRPIIAGEIANDIALPKDMVFNGGGCDADGYTRRDREVQTALERHRHAKPRPLPAN